MNRPLSVLIIEDSEDDAMLLIREIRKGWDDLDFERVETADALGSALAVRKWDLVLSDYVMPGFSGLDALRIIREKGIDVPFIVVSGKMGEETAVEVMRAGAHDYILKDRLARLLPAIGRELQDMAQRRQAREEIKNAEVHWQTTFDAAHDLYQLLDKDYGITRVNRATTEFLGMPAGDIIGKKCCNLLHGTDEPPPECPFTRMHASKVHEEAELWNRESGIWMAVSVDPVFDDEGHLVQVVHIVRDITKRKQYEAQLLYQANYDVLTGLPNRNLLKDLFSQARAVKDGQNIPALMLMDLDNFKFINDTLGHTVGDLLLVEVAKRIQGVVGKGDTIARLGGDEFVVVPGNLTTKQDVARAAELVLAALAKPFFIEGREIFLTVSIGIVVYPHDGESLDQLLQHADAAMYHAKHLGKNNFQFFTAEIYSRIHERLAMESRLHRALDKNEFLLHYQPLVELKTKLVAGMEALLRWRPEGEEVMLPDRFIPLLEETGLILPVGEWVLKNACEQLNEWRHAGHDIRLSVNISARQFHSSTIVERIRKIVQSSGCLPSQICLELTESAIMEDREENIQKMIHLREMGFSLSIDDFGTGFSSLNYLKRLPISEIKIDRTFISGLPSNLSDAAIVNTVIHMASYLGMSVVAEGIETEEQLHFLTGNACDIGQGHYFSKPLAAEELTFSGELTTEKLTDDRGGEGHDCRKQGATRLRRN